MTLIYHPELDRFADVAESAVHPHTKAGWQRVDAATTTGLQSLADLPPQHLQELLSVDDDELAQLLELADAPALAELPDPPPPPPDDPPDGLPIRSTHPTTED